MVPSFLKRRDLTALELVAICHLKALVASYDQTLQAAPFDDLAAVSPGDCKATLGTLAARQWAVGAIKAVQAGKPLPENPPAGLLG